ncbi:hypothetical protein BH23VER1_BH23VER1_00580 [soil metagenome]
MGSILPKPLIQIMNSRSAGFGAQARGPKIGPEFTFGLEMQKRIDGPILIIKTVWGGKSLHTDFRPPGAAPFAFRKDQLEKFAQQGKHRQPPTAAHHHQPPAPLSWTGVAALKWGATLEALLDAAPGFR